MFQYERHLYSVVTFIKSSQLTKKEPKIILASLLAPIATMLIPAILAVLTIVIDSSNMGLNQDDDAPVRAAGVLLIVVLPITYPILVVFMSAIGYILNKFGRLSLKNLLIISGFVCIPIAIGFGWPSPFGLRDQLIGLIVFFSLTALCLTIGAICWWYLATCGHKNCLQGTEQSLRRP